MIDSSASNSGILYIVATPIGNRDDITLRALHILKTVDVIFAEDTRHSKPLLTTLGIKKPLFALHDHNETEKSQAVVDLLLSGQSCALISDAGTPLISDPGYPLVKLAQAQHIPVVPIPGPCALIAALSAAGIPCETFTFAGFLPAKQSARRHKLETLRESIAHTLIFYESTHRIQESIEDISAIFGEQSELVLAKELTKAFERIIGGNCQQILQWLTTDKQHSKGEFVLILAPRAALKKETESEKLLTILLEELPLKQAVKLACQIVGAPKNEIYQLALTLHKKDNPA